jgi:hypothetical protein
MIAADNSGRTVDNAVGFVSVSTCYFVGGNSMPPLPEMSIVVVVDGGTVVLVDAGTVVLVVLVD